MADSTTHAMNGLRIGAKRSAAPRLRAALRAAVAACGLACAATAWAQDALVATQEELLKERAIGALTRKDTPTLFAVMDEYRGLEPSGTRIPAGLFFAEADAARSNGDPVRAERAFNDYFRVASPEGATFSEALRTYGDFRASISESTWSLLDTMTPVSGTLPAATVVNGTAPAASGTGLRVAPFSLARRAVTRRQFAEFVTATGHAMPAQDTSAGAGCGGTPAEPSVASTEPGPVADSDAPMVCVSWSDTIAYVEWLNSSTGVKFRLPSADEWEYAAAPGRAVTFLPREWVGDCAVTSGINVTPGSATQVAGGSCKQRTLIATAGSGTTRESRPPDYRAANLGFRLAL